MKESTKEKLKTASLIVGGFLGSCASTYACSLMTAICPPVGIPASIGKFVISGMIAEKASEHAWGIANAVVEGASQIDEGLKEVKSKIEESKEQETSEEA